MAINIEPSAFSHYHNPNEQAITPKVVNTSKREQIAAEPTAVKLEGDVYTYEGVSFERLSALELKNERIIVDRTKLTTQSSTTDAVDRRVMIALRDPENAEKVITFKVDREVIEKLAASFRPDELYHRDDGIIRLNGKAEEYVAGWLLDIRENRGYERADANGNGIIEKAEEGDLNIGFDHHSDYDYLQHDIVNLHGAVGARNYMKYADTLDHANIGSGLKAPQEFNTQVLSFKKSIEKELGHTLLVDTDSNGSITLREGLQDKALGQKPIDALLKEQVKSAHEAWINKEHPKLPDHIVQTRDLSLPEIKTDAERRAELEAFKAQARKMMAENYEQIQASTEQMARKLLLSETT